MKLRRLKATGLVENLLKIYTNKNGFFTKGEVLMSSRYKSFVKEKERRSKSARAVQERVANVNFIPKWITNGKTKD